MKRGKKVEGTNWKGKKGERRENRSGWARKFNQIIKFAAALLTPSPISDKFRVRECTPGVLFLARFLLDNYCTVTREAKKLPQFRDIMTKYSTVGLLQCTHPFTVHDQIWNARVYARCIAPRHITRY